MPKKARYTKDEITEAAFSLVRQKGFAALSARSLAKELGTSTAPIFTAFENIEAVQEEVFEKALTFYLQNYLYKAFESEMPFKTVGAKLVEFAGEEKALFKLLFMNNEGLKCGRSDWMPPEDDFSEKVVDQMVTLYDLKRERAEELYRHLSIYTYGFAVLFAEGDSLYTMEEIQTMLTVAFNAFYHAVALDEKDKEKKDDT